MKIKVLDQDVNYEYYGEGNDTLVLLHGWGQNILMMQPIAEKLKREVKVLIIDLPGHGQSEEPKSTWSVYDYAKCVNEIIKKLEIKNPIMLGHSFGGKVSLVYASKYETKKLILFGSPYCKEIEKMSFKTKTLKALKKVPIIKNFESFAKKHIGSTDYKNASENMRKILVETVNLDITEDIKNIKSPTIIVWGTRDEAVPLKRAYEIENLINDAAVIEYEGLTHYAYLEDLGRTVNVIRSFIGGTNE